MDVLSDVDRDTEGVSVTDGDALGLPDRLTLGDAVLDTLGVCVRVSVCSRVAE